MEKFAELDARDAGKSGIGRLIFISLCIFFHSVNGQPSPRNPTSKACKVLLSRPLIESLVGDSQLQVPRHPDGKHYFPENQKIVQIADASGGVILFRIIGEKYKPNYFPKFAQRDGVVSYSLSPYIAQWWTLFQTEESEVLVSYQKMVADNLSFSTSLSYRKERGLPVTGSIDLSIDSETKISDLASLDEIRVPIGRENIIGTINKETFLSILNQFHGAHTLPVKDFVTLLIESPNFSFKE